MGDFFFNDNGASAFAGATSALLTESLANSDWGKEQKRKDDERRQREIDDARRQVDIRNATSNPGRRGTILTEGERAGAGVGIPSVMDASQTPYPFITE